MMGAWTVRRGRVRSLQGDQGTGPAEGDDKDKAGHDAEDAPTRTRVGGPCAFS